MPKRARYPLFLAGLAIILLGGLGAMNYGGSEQEIIVLVVVGFAFLVGSVLLK
jgi:uncharacterized membrane protein